MSRAVGLPDQGSFDLGHRLPAEIDRFGGPKPELKTRVNLINPGLKKEDHNILSQLVLSFSNSSRSRIMGGMPLSRILS